MKNKKILKILTSTFFCLLLIIAIYCCGLNYSSLEVSTSVEELAVSQEKANNYRYLSDLDWINDNNWSYNGWMDMRFKKTKTKMVGH